MPKVSVIVPIYGVEKYIERCARSLFEQSLEDIEYIFVDDCTKDNSISLLNRVIKDYPNRQNQIKIIQHEQNKGLSHARETGIYYATGDYIAHCDSDDWVGKDMYETLYYEAEIKNLDIVKCAYNIVIDNCYIPNNVYREKEYVSVEDAIKYLLSWKKWNSIWSLLAKRDLYKGLCFTDYAMMEDFFVVFQLFQKAIKIGYVDTPFYFYFQNTESICGNKNEMAIINKNMQAIRNIKKALALMPESYHIKYKSEIVRLKFEAKIILIPIMNKWANYVFWHACFPEISLKVFFTPYLSIKEKVQYLLVLLRLYPVYSSIVKR